MSLTFSKTSPEDTMSSHGKSFYFASRFFSKNTMHKVATLYSFCRYIDDCADELSPSISNEEILKIKRLIQYPENHSELSLSIENIKNWGVQERNLLELIDGALFDVHGGKIETEEELHLYCYLVAGVVGLMMCPLIGVRDQKASIHAVYLGMAMQLTNICRDVLEDSLNGRCYLPESELRVHKVNIKSLENTNSSANELRLIVLKYLDKADQYYRIGYEGLSYIPFRPRLAILVAGEVYRHIGVKIKHQRFRFLKERTYLNTFEKILVVLKTSVFLFKPSFWSIKNKRNKQNDSLKFISLLNRFNT
ncbi:MAG: squalene/phytoene synthase family protein [Bdellovibrionales bacterium]|nr:squalene/phytoene synthase family protein [Bdellovibrionales bacterium]